MENDITNQKYLLPNIKLSKNSENEIDFSEVLDKIKTFPIQDSILFYFETTN